MASLENLGGLEGTWGDQGRQRVPKCRNSVKMVGLDVRHVEDILSRKSFCDVQKPINIGRSICKYNQRTHKHVCVHVCVQFLLHVCQTTCISSFHCFQALINRIPLLPLPISDRCRCMVLIKVKFLSQEAESWIESQKMEILLLLIHGGSHKWQLLA